MADGVQRRRFVRLLAGATLLPDLAYAQRSSESPKVGYVYTGSKTLAPPRISALVEGLRASGFAPAQVELVVRVTDGDPDALAPMLAEVLDKKVSVFIANGPVGMRQRIEGEVPKWRDIIAKAGIKPV